MIDLSGNITFHDQNVAVHLHIFVRKWHQRLRCDHCDKSIEVVGNEQHFNIMKHKKEVLQMIHDLLLHI